MCASMKLRALLALSLLISSVTACGLVWSYDDYKDEPDTTSSGGSTASGSGTTTSSTTTTTTTTTSTTTSSTTTTTTTNDCVDPNNLCDCDGDGDNATTPECALDGGADSGDCDDHDPQVNSKQTMWFQQMGPNGWDYNCNNKIEFEHTGPIQCPLLVPCDGPPQYIDAPPSCGEVGAYATCVQKGVGCVPSNQQGLLTQGCH